MASSFDTEFETPEFDNLAKLADNLVYLLPGCADIMIRKTIQEVYRDFCRRSCCLLGRRHFVLEGDCVSVASVYGGSVESVAEVRFNGHKLLQGRDYSVSDNGVVTIRFARNLVPVNLDSCNLPRIDVAVVEIPKIGSENAPAGFIGRYGEYICAGVLAKLQSMTGKAWSDPQQASSKRIEYENSIGENRMRYYTGSMAGSGNAESAVDASDMI